MAQDRRLVNVYNAMKQRCNNPNQRNYARYGGKGVRVCDRWMESYSNFYEDIGHLYKLGLTIDRIDPRGNYEPGNVRWVTTKEQQNNKLNNTSITIDGETKNLTQWIEHYGLKSSTVRQRYYVYKWPVEKALEIGGY